jgi:hypothetical protein
MSYLAWGYIFVRIRVEYEFGTCLVHRTSPKSVSDMCLARSPISGQVSFLGNVSVSHFLMQVGVVRCFGVQLRVFSLLMLFKEVPTPSISHTLVIDDNIKFLK